MISRRALGYYLMAGAAFALLGGILRPDGLHPVAITALAALAAGGLYLVAVKR